jgi:hypothetical protein
MPNRLLGHLAPFGSFSIQSEVLCTQGLAYVLRSYAEAGADPRRAAASNHLDPEGCATVEMSPW